RACTDTRRRRAMTSVRRNIAGIVWTAADIGMSPAAFYVSRAAGVGVVRALITATVVAGIWLGVGLMRTRKVDALALLMMTSYAVMLAMAAATNDPRLMLLRDPVISAACGIVFLVSCLTARPATAYLAERLHDRKSQDLQGHRVQTLVWGVMLATEATARGAL